MLPKNYNSRLEVWPLRVGVRLFRPKRTSQNWAQQSATTGGLVQTHAGAANTGGYVQSYAGPATIEGNVLTQTGVANSHDTQRASSRIVGHHPVPPATPISTSNRFSLLGQIGSGTPTAGLYVQN